MHFQCWNSPAEGASSLRFLKDLALTHLALCNSRQAEAVRSFILNDEWDLVLGFEISYEAKVPYRPEETESILHLRQALALFTKNKDLPLILDREKVAFAKFEAAEDQCRLTNECFSEYEAGRFRFLPFTDSVLHAASRKIASILGDVPSFDEVNPRFGPGATVDLKKSAANPRSKIDRVQSCSEAFVPLIPAAFRCMESMLELHGSFTREDPPDIFSLGGYDVYTVPVTVSPGRLSFVPKTAKTDRAIVVEPSLNGMFQMAYGDYIAKKLRRWGIDISDQTYNQRLAREGSITGELATLDLSSASDTVASGLLAHLLPLPWFQLLERLRSRSVTYKGKEILLSKFSSMGNGFTFPLETLIFYAISSSVTESLNGVGAVMVYGDDIIVPSTCAPTLAKVLVELGFSVNTDKSFWDGPFRESCGKDYYYGADIRPCYIKETITPASLFTLHNHYVRVGLEDFASKVAKAIPKSIRLWGPPAYGDGHLHTHEWTGKPHQRMFGWGGFTFDTWSYKGRSYTRPLPGDWVFPLYSIYRASPDAAPIKNQSDTGKWITPLPGISGVKRISIYTLLPPPRFR